jgi:hypothetical protein
MYSERVVLTGAVSGGADSAVLVTDIYYPHFRAPRCLLVARLANLLVVR